MACKIFREAVHRVHEVGVTNISRSVQRGSWVIFPLAVNSWQEELHGGHSFLWQTVHFEEKAVGAGVWKDGISCPPGLCVSRVRSSVVCLCFE